MAEMFLKLQGVEGEAVDGLPLEEGGKPQPGRKNHNDEIEVLEWNWHFENASSFRLTQQEAASKVVVHDIVIVKAFDKASVTLMHYCTVGQHIPTATLTCRKNAGDDKVEYMVIDFKGVMVKDIMLVGKDRELASTETITLSFEEFHAKYTPQTHLGGEGKAVVYGFNTAHHKPV